MCGSDASLFWENLCNFNYSVICESPTLGYGTDCIMTLLIPTCIAVVSSFVEDSLFLVEPSLFS